MLNIPEVKNRHKLHSDPIKKCMYFVFKAGSTLSKWHEHTASIYYMRKDSY